MVWIGAIPPIAIAIARTITIARTIAIIGPRHDHGAGYDHRPGQDHRGRGHEGGGTDVSAAVITTIAGRSESERNSGAGVSEPDCLGTRR